MHEFDANMPQQPLPATLLRRLAAALYDSLLIFALWMAGTLPLLALFQGEAVPSQSWWYPLYLLFICGAFHVWFWTHGGQTLGMRAWRLWVLDEAGNKLGAKQASLRYIIASLSWLTIVGLLWCLIEARGRAAHDILCHSNIIHLPKKS